MMQGYYEEEDYLDGWSDLTRFALFFLDLTRWSTFLLLEIIQRMMHARSRGWCSSCRMMQGYEEEDYLNGLVPAPLFLLDLTRWSTLLLLEMIQRMVYTRSQGWCSSSRITWMVSYWRHTLKQC